MSLNNKFWDACGLISRGQACSVSFQDLFCLPTTHDHSHWYHPVYIRTSSHDQNIQIRKSVDQNHVVNIGATEIHINVYNFRIVTFTLFNGGDSVEECLGH